MFKTIIGIIFSLLVANTAFAQSFDFGKCLDTIRIAESSGRNTCIGDKGKSRGAYQIQENTWKQYSELAWEKYAHDPVESRIVAGMIVSNIVKHCKKNHQAEWGKYPMALVCFHYNCGVNTRRTLSWWMRINKNKMYATTYKEGL